MRLERTVPIGSPYQQKDLVSAGRAVRDNPDGTTTYTDWEGNSVTYDIDGYPNFSPYAHQNGGIQTIEPMTGIGSGDKNRANAARGIPQPDKWLWHHHQDGKTMILIPEYINQRFSHSGGAANARNGG